ncbi:hypothetical protein PMAYCL1PPCAC_07776, partial [Pristionchus mayeri]
PREYSATEPTSSSSGDGKTESITAPPAFNGLIKVGKMTKFPRCSRESWDHERDRMTYEHMLVRYGRGLKSAVNCSLTPFSSSSVSSTSRT